MVRKTWNNKARSSLRFDHLHHFSDGQILAPTFTSIVLVIKEKKSLESLIHSTHSQWKSLKLTRSATGGAIRCVWFLWGLNPEEPHNIIVLYYYQSWRIQTYIVKHLNIIL